MKILVIVVVLSVAASQILSSPTHVRDDKADKKHSKTKKEEKVDQIDLEERSDVERETFERLESLLAKLKEKEEKISTNDENDLTDLHSPLRSESAVKEDEDNNEQEPAKADETKEALTEVKDHPKPLPDEDTNTTKITKVKSGTDKEILAADELEEKLESSKSTADRSKLVSDLKSIWAKLREKVESKIDQVFLDLAELEEKTSSTNKDDLVELNEQLPMELTVNEDNDRVEEHPEHRVEPVNKALDDEKKQLAPSKKSTDERNDQILELKKLLAKLEKRKQIDADQD